MVRGFLFQVCSSVYPVLRAVENTATKPAVEVTAVQVWQVKQHQNVRCYAMLCYVCC